MRLMDALESTIGTRVSIEKQPPAGEQSRRRDTFIARIQQTAINRIESRARISSLARAQKCRFPLINWIPCISYLFHSRASRNPLSSRGIRNDFSAKETRWKVARWRARTAMVNQNFTRQKNRRAHCPSCLTSWSTGRPDSLTGNNGGIYSSTLHLYACRGGGDKKREIYVKSFQHNNAFL